MPIIDASTLSGEANPIASNDPIAVALDLGFNEGNEDTEAIRISSSSSNASLAASASARRRITFEELVAEDEIDVPDFMK
jgi:cell division protein FtsZ